MHLPQLLWENARMFHDLYGKAGDGNVAGPTSDLKTGRPRGNPQRGRPGTVLGLKQEANATAYAYCKTVAMHLPQLLWENARKFNDLYGKAVAPAPPALPWENA